MILCKARKIFAVVFAAAVVLTFNACGDSSVPTNSNATTNRSVTENKNVTNKEYVLSCFGDQYLGLYTGEFSNGMPNGEGNLNAETSYGNIYMSGTWVDGKLNGNGKFEAYDVEVEYGESVIKIDAIYDGEWKNGLLDGNNCKAEAKTKLYGQIVETTKESGTFSKGMLTEGKQVVVSNDGNTYTYEGTFEDGVIWSGTEHIDYADGIKWDFNGSFSNGDMWNGTLTETLKNGTTRQTTITNGEPEDKGMLGKAWDGLKGAWDWSKPVVGPVFDEIKDELVNEILN